MKKQSRMHSVLLFLMMVFSLCLTLLPVNAEETDELTVNNGIPVVYVDIDESQGTIADMIASPDHSVYCYGTVSIDVPEGFRYSDFPDVECESFTDLAMSIRGRGNSTWVRNDKKPFKIKLDKKEDLFGLGKNKHWALLANFSDPSLIRNRITAWLSNRMGFEYTPTGVPVDLVMRGSESGEQYLGSYYLAENVRVDDNRLNIDELEEDDTEYPEITGGYLVQVGGQEPEDSPNRFYTDRNKLYAIDTPEFADGYNSPAQMEYIVNHINHVEETVFEEGTAYRDLIDIESAAKYWLFQDFSRNYDAWVTGSTYFYKKRDENGVTGKIFFGPVWDFDFAWNYSYGTSGHKDLFDWMGPMFRDEEEGSFRDEVKKQWPVFRENIVKLIEDGGVIDQYCAETKLSAEADAPVNHPGEAFDYSEAVNNLKEWIRRRLAWYDEDFANIDHLVHKVRIMDGEEEISFEYMIDGTRIDMPIAPEKDGYIFIGWYDQDGNDVGESLDVTKDMVITAAYIDEKEASYVRDLALRRNYEVITYNPRFNVYELRYSFIPSDAQDQRIGWISSDEEIAEVDENGYVTAHKPGTVTLTAVMRNGGRRTFTLYIVDDDSIPKAESVFPLEKVIRMEPGKQLPLYIDTVPSPAVLNDIIYESLDTEVVTVDPNGVLTAGITGKTVVKARGVLRGENYDDVTYLETEVTVIVSNDPEPEPQPYEIVYTAVSGDAYSYTKGSKKTVEITVRRSEEDETCFSHFTAVKADEKELVKDQDYTAVSGSTVITLSNAYLESLKEGTHEVRISFDDGEVKVSLNISQSGRKEESPDTSDHNRSGLYAGLTGMSLLVFLSALLLRRKYS